MKKELLKILFLLIIPTTCISQLFIGENINKYDIIDKQYLLTFHNQVDETLIIENNKIKYYVLITLDSIICYISTKDNRFYLNNNIKVGTHLSELDSSLKCELIHWPGFGQLIKLKTGWYAVFADKEKLTDKSKILFFINFDLELLKRKRLTLIEYLIKDLNIKLIDSIK